MAIYKNSSFGRIEANISKMGAYFTDTTHCIDIGKMLYQDEPTKEVCVLEPSIGDGSAVLALTSHFKNRKIYGVELNDTTYQEVVKNPEITSVIHGDFTDGVRIQKNAFSLAFGNPPYIEEQDGFGGKERLERVFLDRIILYLMVGGVLVWVIPYKCFVDLSYLRLWCSHFETEAVFKFRPEEYAKWHQVVIIGRKRQFKKLFQNSELEQFLATNHLQHAEDVEVLPEEPSMRIVVYPSESKDITTFTTIAFREEVAINTLAKGLPKELGEVVEKQLRMPKYEGNELLRPPIPPKKDTLYLMATSGYGAGLTGSLEKKDLHLQRGVAKVVELTSANNAEDTDSTILTITSRSQVEVRVVENSGKITVLK